MTELEKMRSGEIYDPADGNIQAEQNRCLELQYDYNHTRPAEAERRAALLKQMFASIGEGCYIEPPLHANWGGHHVHLGSHVYANFGLTLVDDTDIYIGDYTMLAPNVILATAGHPILPQLRVHGLQYNIPIHIGKNVWIGAGTIVLPGVTIGDNSVIGAGSIVTRDIPSDVLAFGNPCRVIRPISEHDRQYYYKDREIDPVWLQKFCGASEDTDSAQ